jgi:hypothetical protein
VLGAVNFDHEPGFATSEICEIRTDWLLAAPFLTEELTVPKASPEAHLGFGRLATELASQIGARRTFDWKSPSPNPLP